MGVQEAEKYKAEDDANKNRIEAKNEVENYCYSLKSTINDEKLADKIPADDKKKLEDKINEVTSWLDANQAAEKEEYEAKQKEIEAIANPIMQAMYGAAGGAPGGMPGGMPDMGGMPGAGGAPPADDPSSGPTIE